MANTVKVTFGMLYNNSAGTTILNIPNKSVSQSITSNIRMQGVQNINHAAHEALDLGTVGSNGGPFYAINRDSTNFMQIGFDDTGSFVPFAKLKPGEFIYLPGVSDRLLYGKFDTASGDLEYFLSEP